MLSTELVQKAFAPLVEGNPPSFFRNHVDENVSWTLMGREYPMAGHYSSRAEVLKSLNRIVGCLVAPPERTITQIHTDGDWATVEHNATGATKKGSSFYQEMCWVCRFDGDKIVELRMYQDTALVKKILEENE